MMPTLFEHQAMFDSHLLDATATEAVLNEVYNAFLGRDADAQAKQIVLERQLTVGAVEQMIINSPEFRERGRLLLDRDRTQYDGAMLIVPPARIIYCPIAKVANTSIKDWALRLVGDGQAQPGLSHDQLDSGRNKMQARHFSFALRARIQRSSDWKSVAVIRAPAERLVSAYCDKFGRNRASESVLYHTRPVYSFLNGGSPPTAEMINRGISFRQFCLYLNHTPHHTHDPHWAPQWCYLQNMRCDRLFALERIESFEEFVLDRLPAGLRHVRLGMTNVNARSATMPEQHLADALPGEWLVDNAPPYDAFLTDDIRLFIENHFALDFELHARCA